MYIRYILQYVLHDLCANHEMEFFFFLCQHTHHFVELKYFISVDIHQKYHIITAICS